VLACFHVVVKMYRYSFEELVLIVKAYWFTDSIKNCQKRFVEQFGGGAETHRRNSAFNFIIFILSYLFVLPTSF
jgi:hypothetical protein